MLHLVNAERRRRDLPLLVGRDDVVEIARAWSATLAEEGGLRHNDGYFRTSTRRRLHARLLGENVAFAPSVEESHRRLMASEGHRRNLLDARFTVVGIGTVFDDGRWWITQNFLQPRHPAPAPAARGGERAVQRVAASSAPHRAAGAPIALAAAPPIPSPPVAEQRTERDGGVLRPELIDDLVPTSQPRDQLSGAALPAGLLVFLLWLGPGLWWCTRRRARPSHEDRSFGAAQRDPSRNDLTRLAVGHHQLKTKLAVTCGWSMTLLEQWDALPEADRRSIVDILARTSREAATIADQLLLEERAVAVEHDVRLVDLDLHPFLEEFVQHAQGLAHDHKVHLAASIRPVAARADGTALRLVLEQLVENAAKYSPAGTEILVASDMTDDVPTITISDRGAGFPDDLDPFTAGERGDRSTTGNGLGLYMARALVTAMRGTIDIVPGPGGIVRISLEAAAAPDAERILTPAGLQTCSPT